eukprot:1157572-Pelagomonas_calceolata.AAC.2
MKKKIELSVRCEGQFAEGLSILKSSVGADRLLRATGSAPATLLSNLKPFNSVDDWVVLRLVILSRCSGAGAWYS